jgi:hypothetical protein
LPAPPLFFSASADATVKLGPAGIEQVIQTAIRVIQGKADRISLGLNGAAQVIDVTDEHLQSWSVRNEGAQRYLELQLKDDVTALTPTITLSSAALTLPAVIDLTHLAPGNAVGFTSTVSINYQTGFTGKATAAVGFIPLDAAGDAYRFHTATGGQLQLTLSRDDAVPAPVELVDATLEGSLHPNGESIQFRLRGTARVAEPSAEITILSGNAAVSAVPADANYRLRLATASDSAVYKLVFNKPGSHQVALDFVAPLVTLEDKSHSVDFTVAASAVVPMTLNGLASNLEFHSDQQFVVPQRDDDNWLGFLPATGRARLQWKTARSVGEGKLFFSTAARIEARVGAGLLRQDHQIDYQVLQGELDAINMLLRGPGEILDVQGDNVVGWNVTDQGEDRLLQATLSQPITKAASITVRSQTPLGAFPVRAVGMRLSPIGAIRHSGYLRLSNLGSVRLEPTGLSGMTQLSPEQYPGEASQAQQVFVYRFPAADHVFEVAADRIQPEVNIAELVLYELTETDRVIRADIELDIREAPVRDWNFGIPSDYSVVSVTGASVADYTTATDVADGRRILKVLFGQDVAGRQLVSLHLEKSEAAAEEDWVLPRIEYPNAKSVRGDIGIIGAPGFRITVSDSELLVEKPLSYFPKPTANLQQAFRIREPGWSATMQVKPLDRSIQADVFHLSSLSQETVYGSALINYFVTGAPVSEWRISVPDVLGNVMVDGQDVRTWRREDDTLIVSLHQPVMGAYTLLVTFEEKPGADDLTFSAGQVAPIGVNGERGYIQIVSPTQVEMETQSISDDMLTLDPLELPAEFRLLTTAPPLGTWQYTERPFDLTLKVNWFEPGTTVPQVVEFSEASSVVSQDGELVTDVLYYVKSRGRRTLRIKLPDDPVRLWEVSVNRQPVTARQTDDATLIPLPGGTDPNIPMEVRLRLGKPAVDESSPLLTLPVVFAPVLKTKWNVVGDEYCVLVPNGGTVSPAMPVLRPSGFDWVAKHGMFYLITIGLFTGAGFSAIARTGAWRVLGLLALAIAVGTSVAAVATSLSQTGDPVPLQLSVPILSAGETVELSVKNVPLWRMDVSWSGFAALLTGIAAIAASFGKQRVLPAVPLRGNGIFLIGLGVLLQGGGAPWFFAVLGLAVLGLLFAPAAIQSFRDAVQRVRRLLERRRANKEAADGESGGQSPAVTATTALIAAALLSGNSCLAEMPDGFHAADSIQQQWNITHQDGRLTGSGTIALSGKPGDRFLLLNAPAVLTRFEGAGLRLTRTQIPGAGLTYVISIPVSTDANAAEDPDPMSTPADYTAQFDFHLDAITPVQGIPVLTGSAAIQEIALAYDEGGWDVRCTTAVRVETVDTDDSTTRVNVLLGPGPATVVLAPKARDVTTEETQFFVEASNLYLPGPGVVDGRHHLQIRNSQGQVSEINVLVPKGLTVSAVNGPVASWQFDADSGRLNLEIEPPQSQTFDLAIETQRGLDPLPADVRLSPLKVLDASGEVGLVGIAFGPDAQPESLEATLMSAINSGDFNTALIPSQQAVLHRVYRYGVEGGELALRVAPVDAEVRVVSKQVLSLGDERLVLGVNFAAEISRAGLFQLSFPLPDRLEVESLTGAALHHWAELRDGPQRQIILHLNGKTIGTQNFSLTLSGTAPTQVGDWEIPRFELREATRQTGELVVRPTTGIRLRTVSRQNVSETDPRTLGGQAKGALAFRLLQRDWDLVLGIEQLEPWVTGHVLHEVTLREGQTRSALIADLNVQNASIRALSVNLPITNDDEIRTLRASGDTVSDLVRTAPDSNTWQIQFKRRVVGRIQFRLEYERRGDRENDDEFLSPAGFPEVRQLSYHFGVRAGGRLELEHDTLTQGWQRADWITVPQSLREAANRNAPALTFRAIAPANTLRVHATRHSLADALKLRVASGSLTTILSPTGDQLTAVDVTIEVVQRSSLSVGLPEGGKLFSIVVNGESVNSIRQGGETNAWQFYILPGIDDRTAKVRFVYSVVGDSLSTLTLTSPHMNVPLENIEWHVVAPSGYELTDNDGNLELVRHRNQESYDRDSYLSNVSGRRQVQARQAAELLEQANQLLQAGEQTKARWALNSVANQYALDAASNEDARVQLENLQTQQAMVALNTRRQRLYLDNNRNDSAVADNEQLLQAAAANPILQQDQLNFRPQEFSQLLRGNTNADNAILQQIAGRLVQHQRTTEPASPAILISLPEEGAVYTFSRSVQVAENSPLQLDLDFDLLLRLHFWQIAVVLLLLAGFAAALAYRTPKPSTAE